MSTPMLQKSFSAEAAISPYRLVKLGSADGKVTLATGATDMTIGVCNEVGPAIGERADIIVVGVAFVEAGAAIARGNFVTSDATGRGVVPAPAAGTNNRCIGVAIDSASAAGDVIPVLLSPCMLQG